MTTLGFAKQPLTRYVARGMRAATKGRGLDWHRFSFTRLTELWISEDERHVVCTHRDDKCWQYWHHTDRDGWQLLSVHRTQAAACSAALDHEPVTEQPEPGLYVVAQDRPDSREIRVRCLIREDPGYMAGLFFRLGYHVHVEEVGDPVDIERTG